VAVAHERIDWDRLVARMESLQRRKTILLGLFLAASLLDAPVPESILDRARQDRRILNSAALVCGRLFRDGHGLPGYREWRHYRQALDGIEPPDNRTLGLRQYCLSVLEPEFHDREELPSIRGRVSLLHYLARIKRLVLARRTDIFRRLR